MIARVLCAEGRTRGSPYSVRILHGDCARRVLLCLFLDEETEVQSFVQSHSSGTSVSAKVSATLKIMFFLLRNTASQMKPQTYGISP